MVVGRSSSLLKLSGTATETEVVDWIVIDPEFSAIIGPVHFRLCSGEINTTEAANIFQSLLKAHLERFLEPSGPGTSCNLMHRTRKIEKVTGRLKAIKNDLRRQRKTYHSDFFNALRVHNKSLNAQQKFDQVRTLHCQERDFRDNPWHFAKKECKGNSGTQLQCFRCIKSF